MQHPLHAHTVYNKPGMVAHVFIMWLLLNVSIEDKPEDFSDVLKNATTVFLP